MSSTITLEHGAVIQLQNEQAGSIPGDFQSIPIVDISRIYSDDIKEREALALELKDVCKNVGFFYAKNHGISKEIIDNTFLWSKKFFHEFPIETKMECFTGLLGSGAYQGYFPFQQRAIDGKKNPDLFEAFNFSYEIEQDPLITFSDSDDQEIPNLWPKDHPEFKKAMFQYHTACLNLSRRLVRNFALALNVEENYFDKLVTRPTAAMRIAHYPSQENTESDQNGLRAHTDFQFFTLVNPGDVSGLQVLNKSGQWIQAPPIEGCLVVNIADVLMRMSNDEFVSTVHRVVNVSGTTRYSIPFFFGLNSEVMMRPLPSCVSEKNPFKYEVQSVGAYVRWRSEVSKQKKIDIYKKN